MEGKIEAALYGEAPIGGGIPKDAKTEEIQKNDEEGAEKIGEFTRPK